MSRVVASAVLALTAAVAGCAKPAVEAPAPRQTFPVLWQEPDPRTLRDRTVPRPPYRFIREDKEGASPKFSVEDGLGERWHVKLGPEAHTETAAVRVLDALGYYVEETHFYPEVRVSGVAQMERGREFIEGDERVFGARFEARPDDVERGDTWDWAENPFVGTLELDGLRVLMVLFNNYDARTGNNRVFYVRGEDGGREARYVVADLGASFGQYGGLGGTRTRNDLQGYRSSRFIERASNESVEFAYSTRPEGWGLAMFVLNPFYTVGEFKKQRDLRSVPIEAARWIGGRLSRLPRDTVRKAFEDAGYEPHEVDGFTAEIDERIAALESL
jgi:hypothetical protein